MRAIRDWRGTSPLVIALLGALVVLSAVWFSNSEGLRLTADQAVIGIRAEASMSAAAAARNEMAQALLVASVATDDGADARGASLDLVDVAVDRFAARSSALRDVIPTEGGRIAAAEVSYSLAMANLLSDLRVGQAVDYVSVFGSSVEPAYQQYVSLVAEVRDLALRSAEIERSAAGQVASAARLLVAVIVPLALVLGYRISSNRRQRSRDLQVALTHERTLNTVKDQAIANLSHELRTPLTSIQGFTLAMLDDDILSDKVAAREIVEIVAQESADLARMIDDLLVAARSEAGALDVQISPVDIVFEVDAVLEPMRATGLDVPIRLANAKVLADHLRLRQIMRNLVSNALKHGGSDVSVEGASVGGRYVIAVSDDGPGIPDHVADRLFERFVHEGETPLLTGSVGLGLSITRELARMMNGDVTFERIDGRTHFTVTLPLAT